MVFPFISHAWCISFSVVARVRFSSATYSGVEGTNLNLLVEGDGQNQQPVNVQYTLLQAGTAEGILRCWLIL